MTELHSIHRGGGFGDCGAYMIKVWYTAGSGIPDLFSTLVWTAYWVRMQNVAQEME